MRELEAPMRNSPLLIAAPAFVVGAAPISGPLSAGAAPAAVSSTNATATSDYVVLFTSPAAAASAKAAIAKAGGTIESSNDAVGFAVVRGSAAAATAISRSTAVSGVARNRVIGVAPKDAAAKKDSVERLTTERAAAKAAAKGKVTAKVKAAKSAAAAVAPEPLADSQWDMRQI